MRLPAGHVPGTLIYREKEDMYDEIIELKKVESPPVLCSLVTRAGAAPEPGCVPCEEQGL